MNPSLSHFPILDDSRSNNEPQRGRDNLDEATNKRETKGKVPQRVREKLRCLNEGVKLHKWKRKDFYSYVSVRKSKNQSDDTER